MTYIMPEIALATRGDIVGILDLQEQNLLGRGGLLSVRLPGAFIEAALDDLPQIVARRDGKIVAYLLAGSRSVHAQTPIIKAMFRAYSGSHDAYIYGPICVAESERGHGLATAARATGLKRRGAVADLSVTHYIHGGLDPERETYTMQILRQKSQPTATPDRYSISDVRVGFDGV